MTTSQMNMANTMIIVKARITLVFVSSSMAIFLVVQSNESGAQFAPTRAANEFLSVDTFHTLTLVARGQQFHHCHHCWNVRFFFTFGASSFDKLLHRIVVSRVFFSRCCSRLVPAQSMPRCLWNCVQCCELPASVGTRSASTGTGCCWV